MIVRAFSQTNKEATDDFSKYCVFGNISLLKQHNPVLIWGERRASHKKKIKLRDTYDQRNYYRILDSEDGDYIIKAQVLAIMKPGSW